MTSTTTIAGLLPLLFEKSLQAQIVIPMVISTAFGSMASTVLVLLAIPCMCLVLGNLGIAEEIGTGSGRSIEKNDKAKGS
jgi:multidrug efflux pump subunit AcrB